MESESMQDLCTLSSTEARCAGLDPGLLHRGQQGAGDRRHKPAGPLHPRLLLRKQLLLIYWYLSPSQCRFIIVFLNFPEMTRILVLHSATVVMSGLLPDSHTEWSAGEYPFIPMRGVAGVLNYSIELCADILLLGDDQLPRFNTSDWTTPPSVDWQRSIGAGNQNENVRFF